MPLIKKIRTSKKPLIMGVLNVTPDSFSDGGKYNSIRSAVAQVKKMEQEGADIIDIGAESTGPNSTDVSRAEELDRILPIVKKIREITKLPISIDTYKSDVARQCLELGADMINDVTALRGDKNMARVVAEYDCPIILMYAKDNSPRTTVKPKTYRDVIATIKLFLEKRIAYAEKHGVKRNNIIIDPGMGNFVSNLPRYSYEIIARLREFSSLNVPILIGVSRKSLIGGDMKERDNIGPLLESIAYLNGATIIRTHNVALTKTYLDQMIK